MGSSCISNQKDTAFEDLFSTQITSQERGIQNINQTIEGNFQQVKLLKESLEEGIQISNIQTIVITPRCELEGAKIVGELVKLGNQITIISKKIPESPHVSERSISKKGILKNKQDINVTQSADGCLLYPSPYRKSAKNIKFKG
ncbi:unnamed protein product [Paramecium primaurelia]|uniref:Uncharacterized protein n=1 Tax=Paramecium primaurelia TaxID=5886 RepID=A0A8S1PS91_PARPR|nr:unnamed protein product [Paramecium primaurelia]